MFRSALLCCLLALGSLACAQSIQDLPVRKKMGVGGQGITEVVDQNTCWFGQRLAEFRNQTPRLTSDQHWLPALTAPRLLILCNSLSDQYGRAHAAVQNLLKKSGTRRFDVLPPSETTP
jgi:hypothetical protein